MAEALLVAAVAMQALGAISQGNAAAASAKSAAAASTYNSQVLTQNADQARRESGAAEEAQRRRARQILGTQRAAIAESGSGFTGTALGVIEQSGANAELDALNIRYEGEMKARGLLQEAELEKANAANYKAQGKAAKTAGYLSAGATALSGGYSYYSKYGGTSNTLPWQQPGNVKPKWAGGGYY